MTALLLAYALAPSAQDFFPLRPGDTWVYEDTSQGLSNTYTDRVGNVQEVAGAPATPIVSTLEGKVDGSTFYRVTEDSVLVVAFEQNRPVGVPYPVLKVAGKRTSWEFEGQTQWLGEPAPLTLKGRSSLVGERDVLGERREVLEVTIEASIGPPKGTGLKSRQVALYARDIGLFDLRDTTTIGKQKSERRRRLVSFNRAGS